MTSMAPCFSFSRSLILIAGLAIGTVLVSFQGSAQEPKGMVPVEPTVLLEALPKAVEAWTLTESTAGHEYEDWVHSVAVRVFTRERPKAEPGPPLKATLQITDTGKFAPARALFQDFAPMEGEGFEKKYMETYPTVIIEYGPEEFTLELLVNNRFLVKLSCKNQPRRFAKQWLRRIDFQQLERVRDTQVVPLPETITVTKIDEMDKEKSRSYQLATASGAQVDEENAADAEESQGINDPGADQ